MLPETNRLRAYFSHLAVQTTGSTSKYLNMDILAKELLLDANACLGKRLCCVKTKTFRANILKW